MPRLRRFLLAVLALCPPLSAAPALAEEIEVPSALPYSVRTRPYSGWSTSARGDTRTVGMGGPSAALPDGVSAAEANPAGLAMTVSSVAAQINNNEVEDARVQSRHRSIHSAQWGLVVAPPPWGFAFQHSSPTEEGGKYFSPVSGEVIEPRVSLDEYRFSAARLLGGRKRFALGATLIVGHLSQEVGGLDAGFTRVGTQIGALYRLPRHWIAGISWRPKMKYGGELPNRTAAVLPGFFAGMHVPAVTSVGLAWIPNRFFRVAGGASIVGRTPDASLLRDEGVMVGEKTTVQPRFGTSYVVADFANFKIEAAAGSYYEFSRMRGYGSRLHGTFGIDVNPWFVNTGFCTDVAKDYRNVSVSIGVDVVRTLRTFEIIPPDPVPPYDGWLPARAEIQTEGLSAGLTQGEDRQGAAPPSVGDVTEIIENIPKKLDEKLNPAPEPAPSPAPKRQPKKRQKQAPQR